VVRVGRIEESYLYAANLRNRSTRGSFKIRDRPGNATAEVLGESRHVSVKDRAFADAFEPYAIHLYRLRGLR
jgi:hypothetical protein